MTNDATALLKAGDPDAALEALQAQVRANPADAKLRIFLFQLLCVLGDWKRAITQLKLCAEMQASALPMAQTYREAIICEVYREKVFAGEKAPLIFGEPQEWIALMIEALNALAAGKAEKAAELRARAFEAAPAVSGMINDERFEWVADADTRLGPILEIIINGKYYWMPFSAIATLRAEPPADLRDAVWTAVNLTLHNGGEMVALIPTRYAGTVPGGDGASRLARATHWADAGADTFVGTGQRLLATDAGDYALMDLRSLRMDAPAGAAAGSHG
ncbi:MAG: tetratricopeptide repeat protein [Rhodobacteraceae bacterium]|nr:tetratricopeptide repeat protein [Paracoccaceae bacterium]